MNFENGGQLGKFQQVTDEIAGSSQNNKPAFCGIEPVATLEDFLTGPLTAQNCKNYKSNHRSLSLVNTKKHSHALR
jgi:hypothetical protein